MDSYQTQRLKIMVRKTGGSGVFYAVFAKLLLAGQV
jgi:hypothetical protein